MLRPFHLNPDINFNIRESTVHRIREAFLDPIEMRCASREEGSSTAVGWPNDFVLRFHRPTFEDREAQRSISRRWDESKVSWLPDLLKKSTIF